MIDMHVRQSLSLVYTSKRVRKVRISCLWYYIHYLPIPLYTHSWSEHFEPFSRHTLYVTIFFSFHCWFIFCKYWRGGGTPPLVHAHYSIQYIFVGQCPFILSQKSCSSACYKEPSPYFKSEVICSRRHNAKMCLFFLGGGGGSMNRNIVKNDF